MRQLLTQNVATSLYWLGRYIERVEATLIEIDKAYDKIIDVDKNAGVALYKKFDIDLEYVDAMDFLNKSIRGDHSANLATIMYYARENTMISRSNIDVAAFGEIIELEGLFKTMSNSPLPIDYKDMDHALSLINVIWGAQAKRGHRRCSDYFLKLGKLTEEVDFRLRFDKGPDVTNIILSDINILLDILGPDLNLKMLTYDEEDDIMASLNEKIAKLIVVE